MKRFEDAVARLVAQGVPRKQAEEVAAMEPGNWADDVIGRGPDAGPAIARRLRLREDPPA